MFVVCLFAFPSSRLGYGSANRRFNIFNMRDILGLKVNLNGVGKLKTLSHARYCLLHKERFMAAVHQIELALD